MRIRLALAALGWLIAGLVWWISRFDNDESEYRRGYRYGYDRGRRRGYNDAMEGSAGA